MDEPIEIMSTDESDEDTDAGAPVEVATAPRASKAKAAAPSAPVERNITERIRLQCMSKLYDQNSTPNTKRHCKKLFEGIVNKDAVVTTAINDLGNMGILSQEIVQRTKLFSYSFLSLKIRCIDRM